MRTPVQLSRTQITTFSRLYKMNARPVQAANGRLIKEVL
jgi:carbonic anhydrase